MQIIRRILAFWEFRTCSGEEILHENVADPFRAGDDTALPGWKWTTGTRKASGRPVHQSHRDDEALGCSLGCLSVKGEESTVLSRLGSAFFVTPAGEFLTAAHVLQEMQKSVHLCPVSAITLPDQGWQPGTPNEPTSWFPFDLADCKIERVLDVAECRPATDLSRSKAGFRILPVQFEWDIPEDGTQVAFIGFPFGTRDPMMFRAAVAAYRPVWRNEQSMDELVLDRRAWPGFSGSPVFLSNGRVIGILISGVIDEPTALTFLRPMSAMRALLVEPAKK